MKLILFADKLPPEIGGMETHAKYFIEYFATRYDLIIVTKKNDNDYVVDSGLHLFQKIDLPLFLIRYKNEPCVVFYNSGRWIESFEQIKSILPLAVFFYRTGGNEIIKAPLSLPISDHKARQQYWVNNINNNIDTLVANSVFTQKRLIDIGIKKDIIVIISGGVDIANINNAIQKKDFVRSELNCLPTEKIVACCCRFVSYKRPLFMLQAFSHLQTSCKIIWAGDGPLLNDSMNIAQNLNLRNITFLGKISQEKSLDLIASADVYCQASTDLTVYVEGGQYIHTEGMGRSLIEAICCGTKVVATNCGALSEYITPQNGILTDGNEGKLADAIEQAFTVPAICEEQRQIFASKYDFNTIFTIYSKLWKEKGYY